MEKGIIRHMLQNHKNTFSLLQKLVDFLAVLFSWHLAYHLRFNILSLAAQPGLEVLYFVLGLIVAVITSLSFYQNNLYHSHRYSSRYREIAKVLNANFMAFLIIVLVLYFFAPNRISRLTLLIYLSLSSIILVIVRMSIRNFLRHLRRNGQNLRHVLLLGNGPEFKRFIEKVSLYKDAGIKIIGWLDSHGLAEKNKIKALENHVPLEDLLKQFQPDLLVVHYDYQGRVKQQEILAKSDKFITDVQLIPEMPHGHLNSHWEEFAGLPLIAVNRPHFSNLDVLLKRMLDIGGACFALLILSPIMFFISAMIKLSSKGPIFYGQERVSNEGHFFTMWKFRSMKIDAENTGAQWAVKDDPRRTKFGTFLRETSLDELPQFWNVLVGEMSLVGPRPERPVFVEKFKNEIPAYMLRHKVKAGITGWAQVNGWRGDTSLEKRIECDLYYINNWSLWLDIKILILTVFTGFINKNAY